ERIGVPIAGRLEGPALAEGGDVIRLDERTLLVGLGYRTNQAGADALAELTGLDIQTFDLPHWHGESEVMHLLSLLSPLADDLVVAYPPLLPARLAQLLAERGSRSSRCRTRSSSRWEPTCSPWRRGLPSSSKGTRGRVA